MNDYICPDCGRRYDGRVTCIGSFPARHGRHAERVCLPEVSEAEIQAGAAALKPYLDHAAFDEVVGDDHDIAAAVLRAALEALREELEAGAAQEESG